MFAACAFPIYVWAILSVLRQVPAWMLRLSSWELVSVIAYTQAFALLESVFVLFCLLFLGAVLPAQLFRDKFVALGSMAVFVTAAWAMIAQYNSEKTSLWGPKDFLPWLVLYSVSIGVPYLLIRRYERLEESVIAFVERLAVLSFFYVSIGVLSVIIVVLRNAGRTI